MKEYIVIECLSGKVLASFSSRQRAQQYKSDREKQSGLDHDIIW